MSRSHENSTAEMHRGTKQDPDTPPSEGAMQAGCWGTQGGLDQAAALMVSARTGSLQIMQSAVMYRVHRLDLVRFISLSQDKWTSMPSLLFIHTIF